MSLLRNNANTGRNRSCFIPLSAALLPTPVIVQVSSGAVTSRSTPAPENDALNYIIVTALKRDTALQDTPISISALSGATLANTGVRNIADLGARVPNLTFVDEGPSQRRVVIRGIKSTGEPLVGTYYDEAPVTGVVGAGNDAGGSTHELRLFGVQRVEVLRGPQGTLYGAGSMGGTLRIMHNKPSMKTEAVFDTSLSSPKKVV
jgi:iron complex outermembrane receptor protein